MSQKLILHVGTHKTGTTAIQDTLAKNQAALRESGFAFPKFKTVFRRTKSSRNAHFANVAVSKQCGVDQLVPPDSNAFARVGACEAAIAPFVEAAEDVILSDEWLWRDASMCDGYWDALRSYLEGLGFSEFRIVVYIRRQDKFAEALWNQRVKTPVGYSMPLQEYLADGRTHAICDYHAGIEKLAAAFGAENIVVRRFERESFVGGDVVPDFLSAIGANPGAIASIAHDPNTRLSNDVVEIKRRLNGNEVVACTDYSTFSISNSITKIARKVTAEQPESLKTNILTQEEREAFLAQFADGNGRVAREYLGIDDGRLFGPERSDSYPLWNPQGPSMLQASERMMELLAESYVQAAVQAKGQQKRIAELERQLEKADRSQLSNLGRAIAAIPRKLGRNRK